jgi:tetratricopeptide (TPR) repeat protein
MTSDLETTREILHEYLASLEAPLVEAVRAAAVPHLFDAGVLRAILEIDAVEAVELLRQLRGMPFLVSTRVRQYEVKELARRVLLDDLWNERQEEYQEWSRRAATFYDHQSRPDDKQPQPGAQIEATYHWLIAEPERGTEMLHQLGVEWSNSFQYNLVDALANAAMEHDVALRLKGRARGWAHFWKGLIHYRYYRNDLAEEKLKEAQSLTGDDLHLMANCAKTLGDMRMSTGKLEDARTSYEQAQALYKKVEQEWLGEGNCLAAMGDIELTLGNYEAAEGLYLDALKLFERHGHYLGEARVYTGLGDINLSIEQFDPARGWYEKALSVYQKVEDRLGEANAIHALGRVFYEIEDQEKAHRWVDEAQAIYEAVGALQGQANCMRTWGDAAAREQDYEAALAWYEKAMQLYDETGDALSKAHCSMLMGDALAAQGRTEDARKRYEETLTVYTKCYSGGPPAIIAIREKLAQLA